MATGGNNYALSNLIYFCTASIIRDFANIPQSAQSNPATLSTVVADSIALTLNAMEQSPETAAQINSLSQADSEHVLTMCLGISIAEFEQVNGITNKSFTDDVVQKVIKGLKETPVTTTSVDVSHKKVVNVVNNHETCTSTVKYMKINVDDDKWKHIAIIFIVLLTILIVAAFIVGGLNATRKSTHL